MPKRLKVGLIGCGRIMPAHLQGYRTLVERGIDVRIAALVARKRGDAERFRSREEGPPIRKPVGPPGDPLNVPHTYVYDFQKEAEVDTYTDYREMLRREDIDAVEIYTPVFNHHTIALDCIEAGKHVLLEKPLAVSVKAASKIVEAAKKAGVVLGVAECIRYGFGKTREKKWLIDQGIIGDVQMVFQGGVGGYWAPDKILAQTSWRHQKLKAGAGVALDFGPHLFNGLRYLCGDVKDVRGVVKTFEDVRLTKDGKDEVVEKIKNEVDDSFFALVNFRKGAIGCVFFSVAGHGEETAMPGWQVIYGSKGCIKGDSLIRDDGSRTGISDIFEKESSEEEKEELFPMDIRDSFSLETLDFLNAIWEGREMEASGQEGLRDMALSFAMIESSILNRPVTAEEIESGKVANYEEAINKYYGL